ncbi:MAG TPA: histidine kinase dimerization/phosphoacceptor domain -containing protein [Balneolales bacterium]|nr:histidine kinase dimerization/phosphoacceptor domain -containing protein [Balneolales bacterium]
MESFESLTKDSLHILIDNVPGIIYLSDQHGNLYFWNKNLEQITQYSEEELSELKVTDLFSTNESIKIREYIHSTYSTGKATLKINLITKQKKQIPYYFTGKLITYDQKSYVMEIGQDITELEDIENELRASVRDKQNLLDESHHRIKNNLASVYYLLELNGLQTKEPTVSNILRESQMRIKAISMLHDKLYQTVDYRNIKFHSYLKELLNIIHDSYQTDDQNIELHTDITDVELSVSKVIPCALIINELLTNSYKYAFEPAQKGVINVALYTENGEVVLIVSDNGKGIENLEKSKNSDSMGMHLIQIFTKQLGATLHTENGNGLYNKLRFPI